MKEPLLTKLVNIDGFLNILEYARYAKIKKMVYASFAAIYGDNEKLPLSAEDLPTPISNYGVEKLSNEFYANVYAKSYDLNLAGLRYFNVFGIGQNPSSAYANAITIFLDNALQDKTLNIFGDGKQTRDFIFIEDITRFNVEALFNIVLKNLCINLGTGIKTSLLEIVEIISFLLKKDLDIAFLQKIIGDIDHSMADIKNMNKYNMLIKNTVKDGIENILKK